MPLGAALPSEGAGDLPGVQFAPALVLPAAAVPWNLLAAGLVGGGALLVLGWLLLIRVRPAVRGELMEATIEVYSMPAWGLRRLRADAFIAFTDESGYLGSGASKYIRDKGDYGLDDRIRQAAPIPPGGVVAVPVRRLPAKYLIAANVCDERGLVGPDAFGRGFSAAVSKAVENGCRSMLVPDPTEDWNYSEHRVDPVQGAKTLLETIARHRGEMSKFKILVARPENLSAYRVMLAELPGQFRAAAAAETEEIGAA